MSRKYVIIDASDVASINFNEVLEASADALRFSLDGSKTFIKFDGATPSGLSDKTSYNHSEILTILEGDDWTSPMPE